MNTNTLTLLDLLAKGTAVLLLGFGCITFLRRHSAAQRSMAWLAVFAVMLVLPLAVFVRPVWTVPVEIVKASAPLEHVAPAQVIETSMLAPSIANESAAPESPPWTSWQWLVAVYLTGIAAVLAFRLIGSWQLLKLRGGATGPGARILEIVAELNPPRGGGLRCLVSPHVAVPMTWGVFKRVLMLPASIVEWSDADLRAALEHELAHIRHRDAARRWLGTLVSALWWPHPLVWIASKAWRLEQERACDDAVVRSGSDPEQYAAQLIDAARAVRLGGFQSAAALVMAMPSGLETRLRAVVGTGVNRAAAGRAGFFFSGAAAMLVITACALCRAQSAPEAKPDGRMIHITTKFVEAAPDAIAVTHPALKQAMEGGTVSLTDAEMQELMRQLSQQKGVDLMSAPSVTTRPGQKAAVEVVREFIYPVEFEKDKDELKPVKFDMMPIGVIVDVEPSFGSDGAIRLHPVASTVNEFLGFVTGGRENLVSKKERGIATASDFAKRTEKLMKQDPPKKGEVSQPVFSTRTWTGDVTLKPGAWLLSCLKEEGKPRQEAEKKIWFFVSGKEVVPEAIVKPAAKANAKTGARAITLLGAVLRQGHYEFKEGMTVNDALELGQGISEKAAPGRVVVTRKEDGKERSHVLDMLSHGSWKLMPGDQVNVPLANEWQRVMLEKAQKIIIPQVELSGASIEEALDFLRAKSRELDPDKQGINIIVKDGGVPADKRITLSLRDVPLPEALHYLAELSHMVAVYEPYAVVVRHIGPPGGLKFDKRSVGAKASEPARSPVIERAAQIIIPKLNFNGVSLSEAIDFLRVKSRDIDPQKLGVNIIVNDDEGPSMVKLTLNLTNIPLTEALRYVTELAGMRLVAGENGYVVQPLDAGPSQTKAVE